MADGSYNPETPARSASLRVWDAPVRLFHWAIVALVGAAWWSAEEQQLDWHRYIGYTVLTLVLFRAAWGVFGSTTARFAHFVRGPARVAAYCRDELFARRATTQPGHNPLGGWSVVALLGIMLLQTLLGLFSVDVDGIESGPLAYLVSFDTGRLAAKTHHLVFNVLLGLVALHVIAILFYRLYKRENLIGPMLIGRRRWHGDAQPTLHFSSPLRALALLAVSAAAVYVAVVVFGR